MGYKEHIGKKYGRLTILELDHIKHYDPYVLCKCDCGNTKVVNIRPLLSGKIKSCGCYQRENIGNLRRKHGMYETKLYKVWTSMKCRCTNPKDKRYYDYGGRGITLCDEWLEFEPFMEWAFANGYKEGLSIDRIDNNKGYCPENCKWSTAKEQARNKRTTHYIEIDGVTRSMIEWSEISGTRHGTISTRLRRGWNPKEAVFGKS